MYVYVSVFIYAYIFYTEMNYCVPYNIYYPILSYTILHYTILYYTILYYTILYYTILYYTMLYYTNTIPYGAHGFRELLGKSSVPLKGLL